MSRLNRPCSVQSCTGSVWAREMCRKHYMRWHSHGDPTIVLNHVAPAGDPAAFLAAIPAEGNGCLRWPYATNGVGYAQINIKGKKLLVSRIVCERRHGPPPSPRHVAAHECGKGHEGCVAPWHLSWKTPAGNMADRERHGTMRRGEDCSYAKLSTADVLEIKRLLGTKSQREIGLAFGIEQSAVSSIARDLIWAHVTVERDGPIPRMKPGACGEQAGSAKLTATQALAIFQDPRAHRAIASDYGISRSNVGLIKSGASWSATTGARR